MKLSLAVSLAVLTGCAAAAAPAARHAFHGHGPVGLGHLGSAHADPAAVHARLAAALDDLALAPAVRSQVEDVFRAHHHEAMDLVARLRSGAIDHDAARAEHDAIVAAARADLEPILTQDQIRRLHEALHP